MRVSPVAAGNPTARAGAGNKIELGDLTDEIRLAIELNAPIVPLVAIGGQ